MAAYLKPPFQNSKAILIWTKGNVETSKIFFGFIMAHCPLMTTTKQLQSKPLHTYVTLQTHTCSSLNGEGEEKKRATPPALKKENSSFYSPAMATCCVYGAFLTSHNKVVDISNRERHTSDSYSLGLFMN